MPREGKKKQNSNIEDFAKKIIQSSELFCGYTTVIIRHEDEEYLLRITKNKKLILTK